MPPVEYFQLDRFSEQAARDARQALADADFCEQRAKDLIERAARLRTTAMRRQNQSEFYRAQAQREYERKHTARETS